MSISVSDLTADKISQTLRNSDSGSLSRRRKIILLSAIGLLDFTIISLYQTGVIRHLADFPGRLFDSDAVNASPKAFKMGLPDGTTGTFMYAANLILSSIGGTREIGRSRWFSALLTASIITGAIGAVDYLYDMAFKQKKICPYCITGALVNFSLVPLALKELLADWMSHPNKKEQNSISSRFSRLNA